MLDQIEWLAKAVFYFTLFCAGAGLVVMGFVEWYRSCADVNYFVRKVYRLKEEVEDHEI